MGLLDAFTAGARGGADVGTGDPGAFDRQVAKVSAARAYADLRQFPRDSVATRYARKVGFPPWERESLTYSEKRGGSVLGFGLVDNPLDTSPGEARAGFAVRRNNLRAQVRLWFDEGRTDDEIRGFIQNGQGVDPFLVIGTALSWNGIPPDILKRFGLI